MQTNGAATSLAIITHIEGAVLTEEMKIKRIGDHFREIMRIMGLDVDDPGIVDTPQRVAKMYVREIFSGLDPSNKPVITLFEDKSKHNKMIIEKDITIYSYCEHHFVPIIGKAHVAYISHGKLIGLSKLNRIVQYHARKPQLQERLTEDIAISIQEALDIADVAVMVDAVHLCVASRGIRDSNSSTVTTHYGGKFRNENVKQEFLLTIK
ncbi:MAG TPA: GTP cyclohydrolase I FolE [Chitinophagaceae bacterium]